jgi:putative transcriptional regulator
LSHCSQPPYNAPVESSAATDDCRQRVDKPENLAAMSELDSLRGHYLISAKRLRDHNFYKTVVLLVEHGSDGAMGLVVNRPSCVTVAHALSEHFKLPETDDLVYVGGPVEPSALFILHNSVELDGNESPVIPGVFVGSSAEVFEQVVRSSADGDPDVRFRIFSGCAGWAPEQLEGELARGDWHHLSADENHIFGNDPYSIWDTLIARVYESNRILEQPCNPEWN